MEWVIEGNELKDATGHTAKTSQYGAQHLAFVTKFVIVFLSLHYEVRFFCLISFNDLPSSCPFVRGFAND